MPFMFKLIDKSMMDDMENQALFSSYIEHVPLSNMSAN